MIVLILFFFLKMKHDAWCEKEPIRDTSALLFVHNEMMRYESASNSEIAKVPGEAYMI